MNKEQIHKFKEMLETERTSLEHAMSMLGFRNPETGDWEAMPDITDGPEADEHDLSTRTEEFDERSATLLTLEVRLREVLLALGKITADTYGICELSGEEIEEERLMANPAATTCIAHMNTVR